MKLGVIITLAYLAAVSQCQSAGLRHSEVTSDIAQKAVAEARQGKRAKLGELIESPQAEFPRSVMPALITLLEDDDAQVQLFATRGLGIMKRPESKDALMRYLRNKDFGKLEKLLSEHELDEQQYGWHIMAATLAVMALGEVGDESAIPLLESLRDIKDLTKGNPVEHALVKLGGGQSNGVYRLRPNAKNSEISGFRKAVRDIRDPKQVPALIATIRDPASHGVRDVALEALGDIQGTNALPFVLQVIKDTNYPTYLRDSGITVARRIDPQEARRVAQGALDTAGGAMRWHCLYALTLLNPDQYVEQAISFVLDTSMNIEERLSFVKRYNLYVDDHATITGIVQKYRVQFEKCLHAQDKDGAPADDIRYETWKLINMATGAEPYVEFSGRNANAADCLHALIRNQLEAANYRLRHRRPDAEIQRDISEKYGRIVQFADKQSEKP
jgi:HEAT repeat protein